MAVTTDRHYRQLLATSLAFRSPGIEDLISNSNVIMATIRENNLARPYYGPEIRQTLRINKQDAQWFTGYDILRNSPIEKLNDAVWTPKNVAVPISLTGTELLANEGRAQIHDILEEYMETAETDMQDAMEVAVHSDGSADNGRQMIGLGGALPIIADEGVYGGIDRAQHALWRTSTFFADTDFPDIGTEVDATTIRPMYEDIIARRSRGSRAADLLVASRQHYLAYSASLVAHQRITSTSTTLGRLGFQSLEFAGAGKSAQVVLASGVGTQMPDNTTYGIEGRSLILRYHPSRNYVPLFEGEGQMPINQDAIGQFLVWNGELTLVNPLFSWRLTNEDPS